MRAAPCGASQQRQGGPAPHLRPPKRPPASGTPWLLLLLLLAGGASPGAGAPVESHSPHGQQELQMWNESDDALEYLCVMVLDLLQKTQELDENSNTKRLSVLHPLVQLVVQLHEMRLKNYEEDDELRIPVGIHRRGYFIYRDPNEDTEWNDVLRDFGIIPPKEEVKDETEEMVLRLQKEAEVKPYERMNLKELKEAEDEFDEEDMKAIEMYRKQRLEELKSLRKRQRYGELIEISGEQYVKEVTNAPNGIWVVIHLYSSSNPVCSIVNRHLSLLATKFPETKMVKAIASSCIENYPDSCLPTLFVYENGEIKSKFIGASECGGTNLTAEELEWKLAEVGAVNSELEENPKKKVKDVMTSSLKRVSMDDS